MGVAHRFQIWEVLDTGADVAHSTRATRETQPLREVVSVLQVAPLLVFKDTRKGVTDTLRGVDGHKEGRIRTHGGE